MTDITKHEGSKYLHKIHGALPEDGSVHVDVYAVIDAFTITCPARQHALKKLMCTGTRGKGDAMADLKGALAAVNRAIELEAIRDKEALTAALDDIDVEDPDPLIFGRDKILGGKSVGDVIGPAATPPDIVTLAELEVDDRFHLVHPLSVGAHSTLPAGDALYLRGRNVPQVNSPAPTVRVFPLAWKDDPIEGGTTIDGDTRVIKVQPEVAE